MNLGKIAAVDLEKTPHIEVQLQHRLEHHRQKGAKLVAEVRSREGLFSSTGDAPAPSILGMLGLSTEEPVDIRNDPESDLGFYELGENDSIASVRQQHPNRVVRFFSM